ncbi:thiamine-binding protein [Fusobacterium russii]|uniref:thiamine-binding protein n=1 Tax=Fusobacterium russii TaxID=854 RepID=UPI0003A873AD|nr:thiamine-binding protein [Fusobacterium russii]
MKEINASIAIQVLPDVKNNDELIKVVDEVISYIKSRNLKTHVGPFETTIEGNYQELMEIIKECQLIAIKAGASGLMSYIKINYRPKGDLLSIDKKISKYS